VAPRDAGPSSRPAPKSLSLSSAGRDALGRDALGRDSLGRDPPRAAGAGATSSRSTRGRRPRGRSNSSSRAPESRETESRDTGSRETGSRATGVSTASTKSAESATGRRLRPRVVGRRAGRSSSSALTRSTLARSTAGEAAGVESTASLSSASGRRRRTVPREADVPAAGRRLRVLGSAAVPSSSPAGFLAFGGGSSSPKSTSRSVNAASSQLKSSSGSGDVVLLRAIPHSVANTNTAKPSAHPGRSATHLICSRPGSRSGIIASGQSLRTGPFWPAPDTAPKHSRAASTSLHWPPQWPPPSTGLPLPGLPQPSSIVGFTLSTRHAHTESLLLRWTHRSTWTQRFTSLCFELPTWRSRPKDQT
jgi:hypothetical protein